MLYVELIVFIIAVARAQELSVLLRYHNRPCLPHYVLHALLLQKDIGILPCLVIVAEATDNEVVQTLCILYSHIKRTPHEAGKVKACYLEEQLILVDRVWGIGYDEHKVGVSLVRQSLHACGVLIVEHSATPVPHSRKVEFRASQPPTLLHAIHYHAGHLAHRTFGILLHYALHSVHT